jgi:hypothetical protein
MPDAGARARGTQRYLKTKEVERKEKVDGSLTREG